MLKPGCILECPGCHHREMTEQESLEQKFNWLKKMLPWHEAFYPVESLHDESRLGYRSKVCLHTKWLNNRWAFGLIVRDTFIDISTCPVHNKIAQESIRFFSENLPSDEVFPLTFYAQYDSQIVFIVKSLEKIFPFWQNKQFISGLESIGIKGLWIHQNPSAGKRLFEKTPLLLVYGSEFSYDENKMAFGIGAFQQLIPVLYLQSLNESQYFFNAGENDLVVDLYCGTGQSLKRWENAKAVIGVELNGFAMKFAQINTPWATLLRGKCSERIPQINAWLMKNRGVGSLFVYANPPRTGLEPEITDQIINNWRPDKIAYLSCSAGTLRKDLDCMTENKYRVRKIIPYDFFPQTHHIETLILIEKTG
ncbi:MAG: hypothetical protein HC906_18980 [Bacteroidales bacterium]|nr:hypothetical protein [Bacteroidales bacterium]